MINFFKGHFIIQYFFLQSHVKKAFKVYKFCNFFEELNVIVQIISTFFLWEHLVDSNTELNIANRLKKLRHKKNNRMFEFLQRQNLIYFTNNIDFDTKSLRVSPVKFFYKLIMPKD